MKLLDMQLPTLMPLGKNPGWFGQLISFVFLLSLHIAFAGFGWSLGATEAIRDDFSASHADALSRVSAQLGASPYREDSWPSLEEDLAQLEGQADRLEVQLIRLSAALLRPDPRWKESQKICAELSLKDCSLDSLASLREELQ